MRAARAPNGEPRAPTAAAAVAVAPAAILAERRNGNGKGRKRSKGSADPPTTDPTSDAAMMTILVARTRKRRCRRPRRRVETSAEEEDPKRNRSVAKVSAKIGNTSGGARKGRTGDIPTETGKIEGGEEMQTPLQTLSVRVDSAMAAPLNNHPQRHCNHGLEITGTLLQVEVCCRRRSTQLRHRTRGAHPIMIMRAAPASRRLPVLRPRLDRLGDP